MKTVMLALIIGALGAAGFWYITENNRKDREVEYQRRQEKQAKAEAEEKERIAQQKAEDERTRKERAAAVAKEDAVRLFLNYIDREEERLKEEVEEAKIMIEKINVDQDSLEDELKAIERANEMRVSNSEKRGESQRDKVERVRALLKSTVINRLARTYCGNDLSTLRSEFESEMQKIKEVDDRYKKRFSENVRKYDETVKGVDAVVEKKTKAARAKFEAVQKQMDPDRLARLKRQLEDVEKGIDRILRMKSKSRWDERKLEQLQQQQITLQNQLSQYQDITGLASGNIAHIEATEAETEARRKYDRAGKTLTMENDLALLERDHEQDVYNRVREFERVTLENIHNAMNARKSSWVQSLGQAQKHLGYLKTKAVNLDFLSAEEIADMRRDIAKNISKSIVEVEEGK